MINIAASQARYSDDYKYIIDSDGRRVELDDSRIVVVWPINNTDYTLRFLERVFAKRGRRFRIAGESNNEILRLAKKLCSGRECLPCNAITGATLRDIQNNRKQDEITIYFNLDQEGPCQNGAWPVIWDTFAERLNLRNTIFCEQHKYANRFLRMGRIDFGLNFVCAFILGDLIDEAENALRCLARNREEALVEFRDATNALVENSGGNIAATINALVSWSKRMEAIPLIRPVEEAAKILIFGGLNVLFINEPIKNYFIEQGIVPKVVDFTEGVCWLESEQTMRNGFKRNITTPAKQFRLKPMLWSLLKGETDRKETYTAYRERINVYVTDRCKQIFRAIMKRSGLVFDIDVPFPEILEMGHKYVSFNGFHETTVTTGRYLCSIRDGVFDGLVGLGSFNCQPAMNAHGIIRPIANKNGMPYTTIDCEGPWLSANQLRLLETVAVQAKRVRKTKNSRPSF